MTRTVLILPLFLAAAACTQATGPSDPYAFVGSWDCAGTIQTFTNTGYNDGTKTYPIQNVARDDRNYTLRFANGYVLGLAAVTDTGLTKVTPSTGDQVNCRRVN